VRNEICRELVALAQREPFFFLTGDLGFMAFEPLRDTLGASFVNAGVSEQNMVSVAAGLVRAGCKAWVYSIAPFCYARPFEQIRNDICINRLPVKLLANGGGYAYGVMGASHHALEDYGTLLGLEHMRVFVPAFGEDLAPIVATMGALESPAYLRLGRSELPGDHALPDYAPWRRLLDGDAGLVAVMGPLAGPLIGAARALPRETRPEIWVVTELPIPVDAPPPAFLGALARTRVLGLVEEHVAQGGFAQNLLWTLASRGVSLPRLVHAHARGYPSGTYGSQQFHRRECGLDPAAILGSLAAAGAQH
jgi:transketolase